MSALALLLLLALDTLTLAGLLPAANLLPALLAATLLTTLSAARLLATLFTSELLPALSSTSALATNFRLLSMRGFLSVLFLLLLRMLHRFVVFFLLMFTLLEFFSHVETSFVLVARGRMWRQDGPLRWMRQNRKYCWWQGNYLSLS